MKKPLLIGFVLLFFLGVGVLVILRKQPANGPIFVDLNINPPAPVIPVPDRLAVFRQSWDSDGHANWPIAEWLATMSDAAYQESEDAAAAFDRMGFWATSSPIIVDSMAAYVVSASDVMVITFRGTNDRWDWLANLDNRLVATNRGWIHSGFHNAYGRMKPLITAELAAKNPKYVWLTGHSLGGALAVVCAYDFIERGIPVDGLVTFGQPMIAQQKLAAYLNGKLRGRYLRFVNEQDGVPRIPPFFDQFGSLVWFSEGQIKRNVPQMAAANRRGRRGRRN